MSKRYPGGILRKTPQTPTQTSAQGIWDMASVTQAVKENTWPIAGVPDPISRSLRFRSSASAYLNRTPASAGNRQKWTWSGWVKRGALSSGSYMDLFTALSGANDFTEVRFHWNANDDTLVFTDVAGGTTYGTYSTNVYRDPSAWYHVVCSVDTTQATNTNRVKLYVNGVQVTQNAASGGYPLQNTNTSVNATVEHRLGGIATYGRYFDGYMTEVYLIDGQALTPSSFGSTNDQTGVWQPIAYTSTYGTNGFYLPFSNTASTATLGYDFSGNSNNWTTNNISLTSGSTYDSMVDVPTQWIPYNTAGDTGALWRGNYCTLNAALQAGGYTLNDGNLNWARTGGTGGTNDRSQFGTIGVTSGKWYWEFTAGTVNANSIPGFGIAIGGLSTQSWLGGQTGSYFYESDGLKYLSGTGSSYGATFATGDIIGIAFDADAGTLTFYKNNVSQGQAASGLTSGPYFPAVTRTVGGGGSNGTEIANFGQRPFSYTPPSGFRTLCTTNLTTPTIGATAATTANKYFNAVTYTGTSGTQSVTGVGFQPDFVWIKNRTSTLSHVLQDAVRGTTAYLVSNATTAENTNTASNWFRSFNSDGFTVATLTDPGGVSTNEWNNTGYNYVSWNWKANGAGSTNTAGSITSTVSANTSAGFSIVTWTGTGVNNATVGHGLGVTPAMIIVKNRTLTYNWDIYHQSLGITATLIFTTAATRNVNAFGTNNPTSSVFSIYDSYTNTSASTYVAYCFAQIAGYSAFGSYTGNGSSDGPFVFTGFRPRFVMIKASSISGENWYIVDATRSTYNAAILYLSPNNSDAEASPGAAQFFDFLSNGFKLRVSGSYSNSSGATYIYMAFAESPFKYALAR